MPGLIMRHGETMWNTIGRKQGRGNSPLTYKGKKQAFDCSHQINLFSKCPLDVYVSPLGRAQHTCEIVCKNLIMKPTSITKVEELAELDYGAWQGLTNDEIEEKYPNALKERSDQHWDYRIPDGESYSMVDKRIRKWLSTVEFHHYLIIAHEMVNRVIMGAYQSLSNDSTLKLTHPHETVFLLNNGRVCDLKHH